MTKPSENHLRLHWKLHTNMPKRRREGFYERKQLHCFSAS